jgi:tRNA(Ile2) C34 agmatinyltransferase TiaS
MLTIEQKKAIYEDYKDRSKTVEEIAKKYGIGNTAVSHIAVGEMGAEPRMPKRYGMKVKRYSATARACPKCRKSIDVKGAKFCCFCGADIRTNKELLIERIENAMPDILHLPFNMRDGAQQLFVDIIKELKGGAE